MLKGVERPGDSLSQKSHVGLQVPGTQLDTGGLRSHRAMSQRVTHGFNPARELGTHRDMLVKSASDYGALQQDPHRDLPPVASYAAQPDYMEGDDDLIKPKKLLNPVKASKSHQDLHRELLMNHRRGVGVENKPELQRVLDQRKREQMIKQRKEEEEARRKISPLEQELLKRHKKLEEMERDQERQEETGSAPEFIRVKENLKRTSVPNAGEKEV
ncbi:hypothetical protein SKAU_G00177160 [Synaphobranchus kaupii]|uniref:Actin-associated protein FAM107A n=1 Tax=Synaphobranchus kaupii TaxID=118154 RepID=A0A9Q1FLN1_SYNKA|nr:hypothetical protein SKAU_G00177160 [Synaphobranchus kaupii]